MTSGTLSSMLAKYLPTFVVGIGIFIVFFAQYSNGLKCLGPCETLVPDVANPGTLDECVAPTAAAVATQCDAAETSCFLLIVMEKTGENGTDISKTVSRGCADPTKGVWFLDSPFKPSTCSNVEDKDKVTQVSKTIKSTTRVLKDHQMAHVCFCEADSCDKRDANWTDAQLVEYFKTWVPPPPTIETTTGDSGGGGGDITDAPQIADKTWKIEAIPKIIVFLIAAVSSVSSLSYLSSA